MRDRHADLSQVLGIAHPRQLQDVRRADRARRQDHLAGCVSPFDHPVARELDADRALALEQDAMRQRFGVGGSGASAPTVEGPRGAGAATAAARLLTIADAAMRQRIDVLTILQPNFFPRFLYNSILTSFSMRQSAGAQQQRTGCHEAYDCPPVGQ